MIAAPLLAGAVHETVAWPEPGAADAAGGADGVPTVTVGLLAEANPVPRAFTAATRNEYTVPLVKP